MFSNVLKQASSVVGNPHRQPCKAGSVSGAAKAGPTCFHVRIYPVLLLRTTTTIIIQLQLCLMLWKSFTDWSTIWECGWKSDMLPIFAQLCQGQFFWVYSIVLSFHSYSWCDCSQTRTDPKLCNCCRTFSSKTLTSCSATNNILRAKTFPPGWPWVLYTCLCLQTIERCGWCRDQTREPTSPPHWHTLSGTPTPFGLRVFFGGKFLTPGLCPGSSRPTRLE